MARGKRNFTLEEQLEKINIDIETMENALAGLRKTKNEIEEQIKQSQLAELNDLMITKGITYEKLKEMLNQE